MGECRNYFPERAVEEKNVLEELQREKEKNKKRAKKISKELKDSRKKGKKWKNKYQNLKEQVKYERLLAEERLNRERAELERDYMMAFIKSSMGGKKSMAQLPIVWVDEGHEDD